MTVRELLNEEHDTLCDQTLVQRLKVLSITTCRTAVLHKLHISGQRYKKKKKAMPKQQWLSN